MYTNTISQSPSQISSHSITSLPYFNVSSRLGFKLWGLLLWLPSLANPCLTLAWASQFNWILCMHPNSHIEILILMLQHTATGLEPVVAVWRMVMEIGVCIIYTLFIVNVYGELIGSYFLQQKECHFKCIYFRMMNDVNFDDILVFSVGGWCGAGRWTGWYCHS